MISHPTEAVLHDFVDGELTAHERARVADHLAGCPTCQAFVTAVRNLRVEAARTFGAPRGEVDTPDQWSVIHSRIAERAPRARREGVSPAPRARRWLPGGTRLALQAAAVTLLLGLGATSYVAWTWWRPVGEGTEGAPSPGAVPTPPALVADNRDGAAAEAIEGAYAPAFAQLERLLDEGRTRLRPETVTTLEENLAIVDSALRDIREALSADPGVPAALESMNGLYRAKLELLRHAVTLTYGT